MPDLTDTQAAALLALAELPEYADLRVPCRWSTGKPHPKDCPNCQGRGWTLETDPARVGWALLTELVAQAGDMEYLLLHPPRTGYSATYGVALGLRDDPGTLMRVRATGDTLLDALIAAAQATGERHER